MTEKRGFLGGIFDDCTILWFIILFLLLFWRRGYKYDAYDRLDDPLDTGVNIE